MGCNNSFCTLCRYPAAAYSPRVLLKIILYCYSKGIITSRKIEKTCKDNIIVKALAEDCEPDHATIADFISKNDEAVKDLFAQILLQCSKLKLITGEMFAIDGCKLPSNASKEWLVFCNLLFMQNENYRTLVRSLT